jgi:hypothetical protein
MKGLLLFLAGVLVGANVVYFLVTREPPPPRPTQSVAATADIAVAPAAGPPAPPLNAPAYPASQPPANAP